MKSNKFISYCFFIFPLFLHWTLSEGREMRYTTITLGGFHYSWIFIFYILYYFSNKERRALSSGWMLKNFFIVGILVCIVSLLYSDNGNYFLPLFFEALPFYLIPLLLLNRTITKDFVSSIKYPVLIAFLINVILFVLSSFWDITFSERQTDEIYITNFFRPETYVGGPNASSYFLFIIGSFISEAYFKSGIKKIIFLLSLLFLIGVGACRGAFLAHTIYTMIVIFRYYYQGKFTIKVITMIMSLSFLFVIADSNIFGDMIERNKDMVASGTLDNGRDFRRAQAINSTLRDSPYIGVGHGRVFSTSKDLLYQYNEMNFRYSSYNVAPHNVYVLAFAEYGYLGLLLFVVGVFVLLFKLDYRNNLSYMVIVCIVVVMNTEAILIQDDFWPLFWFVICLSMKKENLRIFEQKQPNKEILAV